jgi:hypothetical protein
MIPVDFEWILIWDKLHWKCYLIIFYAYIKHPKRSSDATWTSILILMLTCHNSNGHDNCKNSSNGYWWHQQYLLLLFWESLTSTTSVATITVATGQISPVECWVMELWLALVKSTVPTGAWPSVTIAANQIDQLHDLGGCNPRRRSTWWSLGGGALRGRRRGVLVSLEEREGGLWKKQIEFWLPW